MENLEPGILILMYRESLQDPNSVISLEVLSDEHNIDLEKLRHYANVLGGGGIIKRQTDAYGNPSSIIFDIRRKNNDPRSPKGSEYFYFVDREKLNKLIERIKMS